jgi:cbb3-type cytochrome oxidase maturation protein
MSMIYILLPIALLLSFGFLLAFIRASSQGQYDDLETPAHRILLDDESHPVKDNHKTRERKLHVI